MAATDHVVYPPEWTIERSGAGSFMIQCECGWYRQGFDTASSARAAGHAHSVGGKPPASAPPEHASGPSKRRWFKRS